MQKQTDWDFKIKSVNKTKKILNCLNMALNLSKEAARMIFNPMQIAVTYDTVFF